MLQFMRFIGSGSRVEVSQHAFERMRSSREPIRIIISTALMEFLKIVLMCRQRIPAAGLYQQAIKLRRKSENSRITTRLSLAIPVK